MIFRGHTRLIHDYTSTRWALKTLGSADFRPGGELLTSASWLCSRVRTTWRACDIVRLKSFPLGVSLNSRSRLAAVPCWRGAVPAAGRYILWAQSSRGFARGGGDR